MAEPVLADHTTLRLGGPARRWVTARTEDELVAAVTAADDVGEVTPQALNYDAAGLVSFNKGCYTGQEIVARLHYRGTPKRRLHRAETNVSVVAGDMLVEG